MRMCGLKTHHYIDLSDRLEIPSVFQFLDTAGIEDKKIYYGEVKVNPRSQRYKVFRNNLQCVCCNRVATYAVLQKNVGTENNSGHFNFYSEDGMMMTKDHIVPRSKGGRNNLDNYQTMCYTCNQEKADN